MNKQIFIELWYKNVWYIAIANKITHNLWVIKEKNLWNIFMQSFGTFMFQVPLPTPAKDI